MLSPLDVSDGGDVDLLFFAFPIAFAEIRGFSAGLTGITFVSIMVRPLFSFLSCPDEVQLALQIGIGIALCLLPLQEKMYRNATVNGTHPEARLYLMMVGSMYGSSLHFYFFLY